jgi:hypothetical protein
MGLQKELETLNSLEVYKLWVLWGFQNQESPSEAEMIEQLSDLVATDDVAAAELLLDIANVSCTSQQQPQQDAILLAFLSASYAEYSRDILPLMPKNVHCNDVDYKAFDAAKNDFFEALWDVISQHFSDDDDKHFEFTITLSGDGCCAVDAWIDAIEAFNLDPGAYGNFDAVKIVE